VRRREFNKRAFTVGAATAVEAARSVAFIPGPTTNPFQDPAHIRSLAVRLADGQREHGGLGMLPAASPIYRHNEPNDNSKDPEHQEAYAYHARQIAWTLQDVSRFDAAENVGRFALQLAIAANDVDARALATALLCKNNIQWGRPDHAIKYAEHGLRLRDINGLYRAVLSISLSRSLALAHSQEKQVQKAVDDALNYPAPGPFDSADLLRDAGCSMLLLGDNSSQGKNARLSYYRNAYESLDPAVASMDPWPALKANSLGWQIKAALRAHDESSDSSWLLMAADRTSALAGVAPLVSSARVDRHVADILASTSRWGRVPEMRDARDLLRAVASPLPAGPSRT
jgi:hypothetical protein